MSSPPRGSGRQKLVWIFVTVSWNLQENAYHTIPIQISNIYLNSIRGKGPSLFAGKLVKPVGIYYLRGTWSLCRNRFNIVVGVFHFFFLANNYVFGIIPVSNNHMKSEKLNWWFLVLCFTTNRFNTIKNRVIRKVALRNFYVKTHIHTVTMTNNFNDFYRK